MFVVYFVLFGLACFVSAFLCVCVSLVYYVGLYWLVRVSGFGGLCLAWFF